MPGNKRYAVNFVTEAGTISELSQLTNIVSVYRAIMKMLLLIKISGTVAQTSKDKCYQRNRNKTFLFLNIFNLFVFEYSSDNNNQPSINSYIVRKELLLSDQTSIELQHTGNELYRFFDAELANQVQPDFFKSWLC